MNMNRTDFDCKIYFPMELETIPSKREPLLNSDLQAFWEDYSLCDLQRKTPEEVKISIEEYKLKKYWLDLEQSRDEPQEL